MILRRWDIVFARLDDSDTAGHPAIVLSHDARLNAPEAQRINVLFGSKKRPAEATGDHHALLNGADGLDFLTAVDCSFIHVIRKSSIVRSGGYVSLERRRDIQRKIRACLGLG